MAMLAHELRGPLAPLTFAASLLQMDPLDRNVLQDVRETRHPNTPTSGDRSGFPRTELTNIL
ncbi:hypothetical protein RMSM_07456 [Rhodopirellula maiorica SM1]|uniref:histidine kinase n=1 Tax=Rhodopirellula maiorica SM1 TaxID=1265738 RepID=M5R8B4_9BACT|nr:hypothetical protein RMSM_07456 [Rhodopirellula maiorica SM1]